MTNAISAQQSGTKLRTLQPVFDLCRSFFSPKQGKSSEQTADQICKFQMANESTLRAHPAVSYAQVERAFRLVYREYAHRGYCETDNYALHFNAYALLPESRILVLEQDRTLVGTVTLVFDSPLGLPCEQELGKAIQSLKGPGRKLAQVSLLTLDSDCCSNKAYAMQNPQKLGALLMLFKTLLNHARGACVTDLLLCVPEKHEALFAYLGFRSTGYLIPDSDRGGQPSSVMLLDLCAVNDVSSAVRAYLYDGKFSELDCKNAFQWQPKQATNLLMRKPSLLSQLTEAQLAQFNEIIPDIVSDVTEETTFHP